VRVGSILVRCVRFDELLAFWQSALGYVPREPPRDGWVVLMDPTGVGPNISLDRVAEDRLPPLGELSRVHLDLYTADQPAEVERLLGLGASRYAREYGPDDSSSSSTRMATASASLPNPTSRNAAVPERPALSDRLALASSRNAGAGDAVRPRG
jgi:hypothetical protein